MSDGKTKTAKDRKLIAMTEPYEVRGWCESLGCTKEDLERAVKAVGRSVREYLKRGKP